MLFDDGVFEDGLLGDTPEHYSVDALLEALDVEKSYSVGAVVGNIIPKPYHITALLQNDSLAHPYSVDAVIVRDRRSPIFQESIINAIYISCGKVCEQLAQDIVDMGSRLQLPFATGDDLDLYWSKMLGLRRRYLESDDDYRSRLAARMIVMKSSGTMSEIRTLIDTVLGMENAAYLTSYWPGELRIDWSSYVAMRMAESKIDQLTESLNEMVMAGITWSTSFPYLEYDIDALVFGVNSLQYSIDYCLEGAKSSIYRISAEVFDVGSVSQQIDAYLETGHTHSQSIDAKVKADKTKSVQYDLYLEGPVDNTYENDLILVSTKEKTDSVDSILTKDFHLPYSVDSKVMRNRRYPYLVSVVISE